MVPNSDGPDESGTYVLSGCLLIIRKLCFLVVFNLDYTCHNQSALYEFSYFSEPIESRTQIINDRG